MLYSQSISAREMQREYRQVFAKANKGNKPVVVFAHNKPIGAVIGIEQLERLQMETVLKQAVNEYKMKETKIIKTDKELEKYLAELDKTAA